MISNEGWTMTSPFCKVGGTYERFTGGIMESISNSINSMWSRSKGNVTDVNRRWRVRRSGRRGTRRRINISRPKARASLFQGFGRWRARARCSRRPMKHRSRARLENPRRRSINNSSGRKQWRV
ncbi:UNVERIFIED_CONTAM: hypothetical protein Slati_4222500 [Sesamum latifolium]|uniref:Uncharacterized protein n=1 Tax=Sesamum latifolium TaxID=2727402 RepID=A0AAW2TE41_9LAMI